MTDFEYFLKELSYIKSTALWTRVMAIATIVSAAFFLITAIFAVFTFWKSKGRDRLDITSHLFEEFIRSHLEAI